MDNILTSFPSISSSSWSLLGDDGLTIPIYSTPPASPHRRLWSKSPLALCIPCSNTTPPQRTLSSSLRYVSHPWFHSSRECWSRPRLGLQSWGRVFERGRTEQNNKHLGALCLWCRSWTLSRPTPATWEWSHRLCGLQSTSDSSFQQSIQTRRLSKPAHLVQLHRWPLVRGPWPLVRCISRASLWQLYSGRLL